MKKRVMSVLLCMALMLGAVPLLGVPAQAAGYKLYFNANTSADINNMPPTMSGQNQYEIPAYYYSEEDNAVHNGVPTRYKYTFLGWSENKNASDPDYVPGNTIILSQNTTLYAVWKFGIKSAQTLTTNGSCVITTDFPGQEQWVKIRLEDSANYWSETGTSQIWSAAEGDPIAELYDANGDFLDWNDNTSLGYNDQNFRIPYSFSKSTTYYLSVTTDYFSSVYDDTMEAYMPETVIVNLDKVQNRYNARFYDTFADEGSGSLWRTIALFDGYIGIVPAYDYNEVQSMYIDNFLGWATNSGDALFPGDGLDPKSQSLTTVFEEWDEVPNGVVCGYMGILSFGRQICWYSFTPLTSGTYHALLWEGDNSLKCSIWEGVEKKFSDAYLNYDSDTGLNDYSVYLRSGKTYYFGVRPNIYYEGIVDMEYVFEICRTATLSYNANGGSGAPASQTGEYRYAISSVIPTRFGYNFCHWMDQSPLYISPSYVGQELPDNFAEWSNHIELNADTTLYAAWSQAPLASVNAALPENFLLKGQTYYYKFIPTASGKYTIYSTGNSDTRAFLYDANGVELAYNDDGGETRNFLLTYSMNAGTTYYYGIQYYSSSATGTIDGKLVRTYSITYNANGGNGAPNNQDKYYGLPLTISETTPTKSFTITYNANGGSVSPSSKTVNCAFSKWNTNSAGTGSSYNAGANYTNEANVTLYAQWTNPTAGTLATPTRDGYTFDGWYTSSSGGSKITSSSTISANTTIYAHWTPNPSYTVSLNPNGGSVTPTSMPVPTTLPTPSKSYTITYNANGGSVSTSSKTVNCAFRNWNTNSSGTGTSYSVGATFTMNANVTLFAQWTNPTAGTLPSPSRDGYTFDGWYTSPSGGSRITSSSIVNASITLYAHWIPVTAIGCDILSAPNKTSYIYKEKTDTSGIVLYIRYSDGSTKTVNNTSYMTFSGLTTSSVGTKTVNVTCEGVSASFRITVRYAWWQMLIRIFLLGFLWY